MQMVDGRREKAGSGLGVRDVAREQQASQGWGNVRIFGAENAGTQLGRDYLDLRRFCGFERPLHEWRRWTLQMRNDDSTRRVKLY
jgi:hypothetical protein